LFTWCSSKHSCWLSPSFLRIRSGFPLSGSLTGAWPLHGPAGCRICPLTGGQASANAGLPPGAPIGVCPVVRAFAGPRRVSDTSTPLGRGYKRPLSGWLRQGVRSFGLRRVLRFPQRLPSSAGGRSRAPLLLTGHGPRTCPRVTSVHWRCWPYRWSFISASPISFQVHL